MQKLGLLCVVSLLIGLTGLAGVTQSGRQGRGIDDRVREQFVGAWRLARLEQQGADGKVHRVDCCGMFVFTRDGHVSVQVMERAPQTQTPAAPERYSQGGYEASYGRYDVDERMHTFTFHVEGALVRTLIGKDLPRAYEFSGTQLIVRSTHPDEHWRVVWERY
jgi:Lipocalin-like domain